MHHIMPANIAEWFACRLSVWQNIQEFVKCTPFSTTELLAEYSRLHIKIKVVIVLLTHLMFIIPIKFYNFAPKFDLFSLDE